MKIVFDVDDVIIDLMSVWINKYDADYDDSVEPEDIVEWNVTKFIKPECGTKIFDYLNDPGLYDGAYAIDLAYYTVCRLRELGHEVVFCTAKHNQGKYDWLERRKFLISHKDYIVCYDKSMLVADVLIDDRPENVEGFSGIGILFDRPHNRSFDWSRRAMNHQDVLDIIAFADEWKKSEAIQEKANIALLAGVGKDAPITVNENGGKQSKLDYRFDLVDPLTMFALANVLDYGARRYGLWNWRKITERDNLNHALMHIYAHLQGNQEDDHLSHALCRLMFALSKHLTPGEASWMQPE